MKKVKIFTDGACVNNKKDGGPGGWGTILVYQEKEKEISGGEKNTTNNKMELLAVIKGLELLKEPCEVHIVSDSSYVLKGLSEWMEGWISRNWKTAAKKPVANKELWIRYLEAAKPHSITTEWVKGHSGHPMNERCDALAVKQRDLHRD